MSILSAMLSTNSKISTLEQAFQAKDTTTAQMRKAIDEWFRLYFDTEPTEQEDPCQRIPFVVVNKITKAAFSEYSVSSDDEFAANCLKKLDLVRKKAMQFALIGGSCYIKPVPAVDGFDFVVVRRDCYLVLERDSAGNATSIGSAEFSSVGGDYYALLERRTVDANGWLAIETKLFRSADRSVLGIEVPLSTLAKYEELEPYIVFPERLFGLGLAQLKTPTVNCVDGSDDPVSLYAPAVQLIHNINRNEAQINGEFERGKSRLIVSGDMMKIGPDGRKRLADDVFTALDDDPDSVGVTIFSPTLREQSFLARKTEYLRNVESQIGLKRGILSEVEAVDRTAKEITSSEGDYNLTIIDFQQAWEEAMRETLRICFVLGYMYKLTQHRDFDQDGLVVDWGDGVLYNREKVGQEMLEQVQAGILKPERYLAWYYELPCETEADMAKIRRDYMPELSALTGGD